MKKAQALAEAAMIVALRARLARLGAIEWQPTLYTLAPPPRRYTIADFHRAPRTLQ